MAETRPVPRVGMEVCTLDEQRLGTVQEVWPEARTVPNDIAENTSLTPDVPPGPLVEPGLFLVKTDRQELYVPFGAIHRIEGNRIVVGVPARDVDGQSWDQRPWQLAR